MATFNGNNISVSNPEPIALLWIKDVDGSDVCILDDPPSPPLNGEHPASSTFIPSTRPKMDRPTRGRSGPDSMSAAGNRIPCPVCRGTGYVPADFQSSATVRNDYYFESYSHLSVHQTMLMDKVCV